MDKASRMTMTGPATYALTKRRLQQPLDPKMTMTGPATGGVTKRRVRQPLDPKVIKEIMETQMEYAALLLERQRFFDVPASGEAILALPTPKVGETAEEDCAVCRQAFKEGDMLRMMPCSHSFHQTCIFRRLMTNGTCPCCRFAMPARDDDD